MNAIVAKLRRLVGIQYEYKLEFQNFLTSALASELIVSYSQGANTPTARQAFVNTFIGCGPSMTFEAKRSAYGALELITEAMADDDDVSPTNAAILNSLLINTTRFVGIAEGDGEDYHFMVATYNLAKEIARVVAGTTIFGSIATLSLLTSGTGFQVNSADANTDTAVDVVFTVVSTEATDPANYADATVEAEIIDGEIDSFTLITDGGEGFFAGQVVQINIDTTAVGQGSAIQTTAATATVVSIID
jgi:hypothetical protein